MKLVKKISWLPVWLALVLLPALGVCADDAATPKYGGVLKIIGRRSTSVLGAPFERSISYTTGAPPVMENLIRMDKNGGVVPFLATGVEIKPEEKAIILKLRKGITFQDGTNFNAEAVKVNLETKGERGVMIREVSSVDVIDDHTVRLNLKEFTTSIISKMSLGAGMMASAEAIKTATTPENRAKDHMIGTGPFTFVDWQRDQYIKYKKFDGYWQKGKPYLDGIEFIYIADPVTALTAFQAGQGNVIFDITAKDAYDLKKKGYRITVAKTGYCMLVGDGINPDSPFAKRSVREAVDYAIDRKAIADGLGFGYYEAMTQPCVEGNPMGYLPDLKPRNYDPEMAKKLLKDAGYPKGFESRIIAEASEDRDALVAIQNYLAAVGIKVKLELVDRGKYMSVLKKGWKNSMVFGRGSVLPDLAGDFERWYYFKGPFAYTRMVRPNGFTDLIDKMLTTYEPEKHKELVQKGVRWMHEDAFVTPLWTLPRIAAADKSVRGLNWFEKPLSQHYTPADAWLDK